MPIVDYNRIYKVRSRERQPVLYSPHMVPDAAGAFLRASAPAINARFADADARAREKQGNIRAQYAAIGNLIGVGAKVGDAYARAVERRDDADFNALAAAWQNHMNEGADMAWKTPRQPDGNGGWTGPSVAIRELDRAFDGTEAFETARAGVKERFQKWRSGQSRSYFAKADAAQEQMADAYQKQALIDRFNAADAEVGKYTDPDDSQSWGDAVKRVIDAKTDLVRWERDRLGVDTPQEELDRIANELTQKYVLDRAKGICAIVAADATPSNDDRMQRYLGYVRDLAANRVQDGAAKRSLQTLANAAENTRRTSISRLDALHRQEVADRANDAIARIALGAVGPDKYEYERTIALQGLATLPDRARLPLEKKLDDAIGVRYGLDFIRRYRETEARTDINPSERSALLSVTLQSVAAMPDGVQKRTIMNQLYKPAVADERQKFRQSNATAQLANGVQPGVVMDQAVQAYKDGRMDDDDYYKVVEACQKNMTYKATVGDAAKDYNAAIYGALDDAFGIKFGEFVQVDENGIPRTDESGHLVALRESWLARNTVFGNGGGRFGPDGIVTRVGMKSRAVGNPSDVTSLRLQDNFLTITERTAAEAFQLGMAHVIARFNGVGDAKDKGPVTPEAIQSELSEIFRTHITNADALTDAALFQSIQRARGKMEGFGASPESIVEARQNTIRKNTYQP